MDVVKIGHPTSSLHSFPVVRVVDLSLGSKVLHDVRFYVASHTVNVILTDDVIVQSTVLQKLLKVLSIDL
jgi:hypothetical protein